MSEAAAAPSLPLYPTRQPVDFVVVGSGAAGGVVARELAVAGFSVVLLEQGPHRKASDFTHDELSVQFNNELLGGAENVQTYRRTAADTAQVQNSPPPALYSQGVGGSSVHFSGNFWRLRPSDFKEKGKLGAIAGTGFDDWPISYEDLEPYYTRVDWEIGVSGVPGPFDPPRSKPYPMPPLPVKSSGVLLEAAAAKLGLHAQPAPLAITSQPHNGRPGCIHCGFCMGFGCEANAKSSTLATMIPEALATGRCELRARCAVYRIETGKDGRVSEVAYWDEKGRPQAQKARAVVLCANGAETPRLLLMSGSAKFPQGLANNNGRVGKGLMFNSHSVTHGLFEEPLHDYKSVQVSRIIHDFYESDAKRGFYGGGGIDARPFLAHSPMLFALATVPPDVPRWGAEYKKYLAHAFTRHMAVLGSGTSLAMDSNNVTLDPKAKDPLGRPAMRITYQDHPDDMKLAAFLQDRAMELLAAAGAKKSWREPIEPQNIGTHLLGTCRMGDDPKTSVVDKFHRAHEVKNLFIVDGSSFVTSGRGQPTMTIQALAFRAAEHIARFAKQGEI
ncbi:MAG: GMC family oxidoreductase [Gammaproteobacteria bacterium]